MGRMKKDNLNNYHYLLQQSTVMILKLISSYTHDIDKNCKLIATLEIRNDYLSNLQFLFSTDFKTLFMSTTEYLIFFRALAIII